MAERFNRLLSIDSPLWCVDSPLIIEKGVLLRDGQRGHNLLQLKIKNVQAQPLKAVVLDIELLDVKGESIGSARHSFLDLDARNGTTFGDDTPLYLDDDSARGFRFRVADAIFTDGATWSAPETMHTIASPASLDDLGDLKDQYRQEVELSDGQFVPVALPTSIDGLWYCTCGALNAISNGDCSTCGRNREAQRAATDGQFLVEQREKAAEATRLAEEQRIASAKTMARSISIGLAIALGLFLLALFVANYLIPNIQRSAAYREARSMLESGKYDAAEKSFIALGDFKDSAAMAHKAHAQSAYSSGMLRMKEGEPAAAVGAFKECIRNGGFKDAEDKLAEAEAAYEKDVAEKKAAMDESTYESAKKYMTEGGMKSAQIALSGLPSSYKDTKRLLETCGKYAALEDLYGNPNDTFTFVLVTVRIVLDGDDLFMKPLVDNVDDVAAFDNWPERVRLTPRGGNTYGFSVRGASGTIGNGRMTVRAQGKTYELD